MSTTEVGCDGCGAVIDVLHPSRMFATFRGPEIGHRKFDFHSVGCMRQWAVVTAQRAFERRLP